MPDPSADFFQRGHTYAREHHASTIRFLVRYIDESPDVIGSRVAFGWRTEDGDVCASPFDSDDFTGWTNVTPEAAAVSAGPTPAADQAALRARIVTALATCQGGTTWGAMADAVLSVLPAPADRATAFQEAAEVAVRAARRCGDSETGQYAASVAAAIGKELRRRADETQPDEDEAGELVCVDECGSCDACGMEPFGTPAEGWREAAHFLRRTPRDSADFLGALRGARLIEDELRRRADETEQTAVDPSWPRRAWDLGLLHKGGDPHHCPACVAQPEPPKDFICPGAEANAVVLANPQPADQAQPKEA